MRVSFNMFAAGVADNISASAEDLFDAQNRVTLGKSITRPSDNIIGTGKVMSLQSSISQIEQSLDNANNVKIALSVADTAMNTISQNMQQAYDLALSMANSSVPDESRAVISSQIDDIMNSLATAANIQFSGNYLFSGSLTNVKPISTDLNTNEITYNGNSVQTMVEVAPGSYVARNITADAILNIGGTAISDTPDIFTTLKQLKSDIAGGNIDSISAGVANIKANMDNAIALRSQVGARIRKVESFTDSMQDSQVTLKQMLSDTEDIDMADAVVKLNERQNVYQAALLAAARVQNLSLADYLS